tara:strand:- start:20 stop:268 length:249 start_codon:yes stop_codon:yes gene_type:complete
VTPTPFAGESPLSGFATAMPIFATPNRRFATVITIFATLAQSFETEKRNLFRRMATQHASSRSVSKSRRVEVMEGWRALTPR